MSQHAHTSEFERMEKSLADVSISRSGFAVRFFSQYKHEFPTQSYTHVTMLRKQFFSSLENKLILKVFLFIIWAIK